ncbi:MAG: DUF368 domain-containing protein [Dysgonomonas sp.]|nr:DUF368 domain-containing protein [Dysgonomonas sp.]
MRKISDYLTITLKGIAMGAADVVPGVSGGTIAFISGIYEELLSSIKSINATTIKLLLTFKFQQFWERINGNFLFALVLGIGISIFSLAKLMTWLLVNEPIATWSFFFGLIIASSLMVSRDVSKWNIASIISLIAGVVLSYTITVISPASTPNTWWFIILSGAIAICAMILPGISGSFILLLLGKYAFIMDAVSNFRINIIALFGLGAIVGIVSFSHFLSWLLEKYRNTTIALLTGVMIGSLNKVWPWKRVVETYVDSHGETKPLLESNILPSTYESINGIDPHLWQAILFCIVGFVLIYTVELIGNKVRKQREQK